ncbi:MAG: hypothetical protein GTO45_05750 [Candidatus Aminicenantes bacterium]|nr:hypothetical protein [Candidatus Aminicenantes bacterium]NIM78354.1 hypothetical protein [Candidatus Aminicenantes bacterium]NIN17588.1 hypothetical protein [Candidatus Aminicenantes bacterium]NIN41466.1 hypothetical protein [Candidatus Aminicenantes bacterium]NIN84240.1 hypothetical protein [Candidatus Aminicenantes bacterium]
MDIIREIRDIDSDKIIINVPKRFRSRKVEILVLPLEKFGDEEGETISEDLKSEEPNTSGLCGLWQDERKPEEIINDIYSHRTGFGDRKIEL